MSAPPFEFLYTSEAAGVLEDLRKPQYKDKLRKVRKAARFLQEMGPGYPGLSSHVYESVPGPQRREVVGELRREPNTVRLAHLVGLWAWAGSAHDRDHWTAPVATSASSSSQRRRSASTSELRLPGQDPLEPVGALRGQRIQHHHVRGPANVCQVGLVGLDRCDGHTLRN